MAVTDLDLGRYKLGWADEEDYVFKPKRGLDEDIVREISWWKGEPDWMRDLRLRSLKIFGRKPMPTWGGDMSEIFFDDIYYYIKPTEGQVDAWDELPESVKATYEKLGIPEAERKYLAGVTAQYECLRGSTLVWTTRGPRMIKELQGGEHVLALDRDQKRLVPALVLAGGESGEKQVFEITARGRRIVASGNHPFLVLRDVREPGRRRARYEPQWVTVDDLRVGDHVAVATDTPEWGEPAELLSYTDDTLPTGPEVTSDDFAWWVGLFLGDGYVHNRAGHLSVEFAVDADDTALVDEIVRVSRALFGIDFELAPDRQRLTARGTAALVRFLDLNGVGGTSLTKRIPEWAFTLPRSQRLSLLAGYVDADGYVRRSDSAKNVVLTSANEALLEDARLLAQISGIGVSRISSFESRHPTQPERTITGFRLHLSGGFDRLPVRSPRRAERLGARAYRHTLRTAKGTDFRAHTSDQLGYARVESITPLGVETVYDITVEGHHNFVAEGFVVHNSEVVYHRNRDDLEAQGVIFCDMDTALREYPEVVKQYFGTVIPQADNKFAALNSAVWSGGSFIYVPPGVNVEMPLQAYFRINAENMGQFERTLIIADEGSQVHYIEGCSAPVYTSDSLHSAVVEIVVKPSARVTYTTIQNWSNNVFNLVTKRARVEAEGHMEWIDGNIGSRLTMKYPAVYMVGPKASGEVLSVAYAGPGQHQDAGAKMVHAAPETTSKIVSKSISKDGGRTSYRGLVRVDEGAYGCKSHVQCDALILDEQSVSDTYPYMEVGARDAQVGHEATVSKVADEQLFYLMSRGLSAEQAMGMVVNGFIEPVTRTLPMEYAVEWSRLIELQMEGSVG
ncbi:MAG: Fe-S cluster assembly protein SufB [Acidimicrobiales bacterium]|nr:Fe-S cluster assembly protein SufB [Acidimicrobiales bacterium]